MTQVLERLTYRSRAEPNARSPEVLNDILNASQRNNVRDQLTGALTYNDGWFIQVLEGPAEALDRLLVRLSADARHSHIDIADRQIAPGRQFEDWSMATVHLEPHLEPALRAIQDDWPHLGSRTADLLIAALRLD